MSDLIKNLDFTLLLEKLIKKLYPKVVKSSDSYLRAITLAVVCTVGVKHRSQESSSKALSNIEVRKAVKSQPLLGFAAIRGTVESR